MTRAFGSSQWKAMKLLGYASAVTRTLKIPSWAGSTSWVCAVPGASAGWGMRCSNMLSLLSMQMAKNAPVWAWMQRVLLARCNFMSVQACEILRRIQNVRE